MISNAAATNILNITIDVITAAQAWRNQVRGTYTLLYPWMIGDWFHLQDFEAWVQSVFVPHIHATPNGPSSPTSTPSTFGNTMARTYLSPSPPLGQVRRSGKVESDIIDFSNASIVNRYT